jgi:ketopantoate reductase
MSKPSVLIVGAGALGVATGYHLNLAGAAVTYLVRPARLKALQAAQVLYCYDDAQLKHFSDYHAVDCVAEAAKQNYDFVLVTLDGASCQSAEGTQLLRELAEVIRETAAVAVIAGIGVREHCRQTMQLPDDRVVEGTMRMFSYQVDRVAMPLHPPTDPKQLAQASMAYRHPSGKAGFMVVGKPTKAARGFADLYNQCGVSSCNRMNARLYAAFVSSFFPVAAVFDLAGWPDAKTMADNKELMSLCSKAMQEIMRLPEHGWQGKLASLLIRQTTLAKNIVKTERDCLPLDNTGFNRFHHGGKVREQDIQVMRQCAESGKTQHKSMPALDEIIRRYELHCEH